MRLSFKILLMLFAGCLLAGLAAACSEEDDCSENARHMLNATICRAVVTPEERFTAPDTIAELNVTAFGTDSVIVNDDQNVTSLSLPLRYNEGTTTMVFSYMLSASDTIPRLSRRDTITFSHDNTPYFLSMDCNYAVKQRLTGIDYTTHFIDSIVITDPIANVNGTENIKIYYRAVP